MCAPLYKQLRSFKYVLLLVWAANIFKISVYSHCSLSFYKQFLLTAAGLLEGKERFHIIMIMQTTY